MKINLLPTRALVLCIIFLGTSANFIFAQQKNNHYDDLVTLFKEWRTFENPPLRNGAPDYTQETFVNREADFKLLQEKLQNIDTISWPIPHQVDWHIVNAEMNGYAFNQRVLRPWERDPAFYKSVWTDRSDVPAHEGPTHHGITELWTYTFPLDKESSEKLTADLKVIPAINEQAKINLIGNAKDLWIAGIRDIKDQVENLSAIKGFPEVNKNKKLLIAIDDAIASTNALATWLQAEAKTKTGPSGIAPTFRCQYS